MPEIQLANLPFLFYFLCVIIHSILKLALHHTTNHAHLHGLLNPATLDLLQGILGSFVSHYHQAEMAAKQREEEEASLYKYRSRSHGDGMTDEQLEEKELRESFPSFEKVCWIFFLYLVLKRISVIC